ncbi:MAG: amidohydrolase/deacetylase family metallohydrolase [Trueperaceae bacterium]
MKYDMVIKGGRVYDSTQQLAGEARDIGIQGGRIAAVTPEIPRSEARRVVEAHGFVVTPGLIDLHVHVYDGVGIYGVNADSYCLSRGVTTALDTGSSGALTFPGFRRYVIDTAVTRIFALLHIAETGIVSRNGELLDLRQADVDKAVEVVNENRDVILGMKVRLGRNQVGDHARAALDRALEAAEAVGLPLMIHISDLAMPLEEMLSQLRSGDILTHCYEEQTRSVLDEQGAVREAVLAARERGILLDVGHGVGSFSLEVAEGALRKGLVPDTISSDVHALNIDGPVYDQATTLAKFLSLGMSIEDVVDRSTVACVRSIGLPSDIGHLRSGAHADVAIFDLEHGNFRFTDSMGRSWDADRNLRPTAVVKGGRLAVDHRRQPS